MTNRFVEGLDSRGVVGVALLVSLSILGCGKDAAGPTGGSAPTPVATTLTLSATALSFSSLGGTEQLTATVRDQTGATMGGASVTWASSASSVVGVSSTGLVTALAQGTATITATSGSASGTASVTVQQVATAVAKVSGGDQVGVVGVALYDSLGVIVNDSGGNAVEGALVQWNIAGGGGSLPPETRTNREGIARAQWLLGPTPVAQAATAAEPWEREREKTSPGRGGIISAGHVYVAPGGARMSLGPLVPRLAPWAIVCRAYRR